MEDTSSAISGGRYQYRALQSQTEIRCLTLSAGTASDPLTCDIQHHNLSDNPSFEAISYVWGSLIRDQTITCNGGLLNITPNLQRSLQQVRSRSTARVLWVDSICINQDDDKEKGHQVRLMAKIYRQAERVLITLGADEISLAHSQPTETLIQEINQLVESTLKRISGSWNSYPYDQVDQTILSDPKWGSFEKLISHPWFKRGWVVQEAGLGQDVQVLWGVDSFSWNAIMRTCLWLSARAPSSRSEIQRRIPGPHLDIYERQHLIETKVFRPVHHHRMGENVLNLLCNARRLELTDKRDRIYAFIGLPGFQKLSQDLVINYDKTWAEVYCDVAQWHIVSNESLLILHYVEHDRETLASNHPSWVPQWHTRQYAEILRSEGREKGIHPQNLRSFHLDLTESGILRVQGSILDTIEFISGQFTPEPLIEEIVAVWDLCRQQIKRNAYTHSSPLLALVSALIAGKMSPDTAMGTAILNIGAFLQELFGVESIQQEPKFSSVSGALDNGDARKVHFVISRNLLNRRFAVTKRGFFGLVPSAAAKGDLYSVLFGADTPFVLRPTDFERHYRLVGEGSLVSSQNTGQHNPFLHRVGSGVRAREDWVDWGLKEEDIFLC